MKDIKVGIALGGGGLCGLAHIGFLRALEENGIKFDMISGISMGSIIGGLYASGMTTEEMEKNAITLTKKDIIELNVFKITRESLLATKKMEKFLKILCKVENIEDCKIKFYSQAADIMTGKMYTFEEGSIVDAMRASSAIPAIFPPVYKNNTAYLDGGLIQICPFNILKEKGADVVIAVNCLNKYENKEIPKNSISMLINSYYVIECSLWRMHKEVYKNDYDIYCFDSVEGIEPISLDLKKIPEIIQGGYESGLKYVDEIKIIIENKRKNLKNT